MKSKEPEKKFFNMKTIVIGIAIITLLIVSVNAYGAGKEVVNDNIQMQWVSHTEYWRADSASTIVRLINYKGDPYTMDSCTVKILYPDKTVFVNNLPMALSGIDANWYRTDSLDGAPLGTYEQEVTCTKGVQTVKSSQSFHLNPALEEIKTITEKSDALSLDLTNVNIAIQGKIADTELAINTNIDNLDTDMTSLLNNIDQSMTDEFTNTRSTIGTQLSQVNVSLYGKVEATGTEIKTELSAVNQSLYELIETQLTADITQQLNDMLATITTQLDRIETDTDWLTTNAMNQNDMSTIETRFTNLDNDLDDVMAFCSSPETSSSALCLEILNIKNAVDTMKTEHDVYLAQIDTTTLSTWQLLSGDIATNIDQILTTLGIIQTQTTEINDTTHEILEEMQNEVQIRIIS